MDSGVVSVLGRHMAVLLVCGLLGALQTAAGACSRVELTGTQYQTTREGQYELLEPSMQCHGRPAYRQRDVNAPNFIFYMSTPGGWKGWMVGSSWCNNKGGLAVQDEASAPYEVMDIWEEVFATTWRYSYDIKVECISSGLNAGAIVGIVFAVLLLVAIIVVVIYCVACNEAVRKRNARTSPPTNNRNLPRNHVNSISGDMAVHYSHRNQQFVHQGYHNQAADVPPYSPYKPPPSYDEALQQQPPPPGVPYPMPVDNSHSNQPQSGNIGQVPVPVSLPANNGQRRLSPAQPMYTSCSGTLSPAPPYSMATVQE